MAFDFEKLPRNAKKAAFAAMDRAKGGGGTKGGGRSRAGGFAAAGRSRRDNEDEVLANAAKLDPNDNSAEARLIRETAESIQDHRASARNSRGEPAPAPAPAPKQTEEERRMAAGRALKRRVIAAGVAAEARGEDPLVGRVNALRAIAAKNLPPEVVRDAEKSRQQAERRTTAQVVNPKAGGGWEVQGRISREDAAAIMFGTAGAARKIAAAKKRRNR